MMPRSPLIFASLFLSASALAQAPPPPPDPMILFIGACGRDLQRSTDRCDPVTSNNQARWLAFAQAGEAVRAATPIASRDPRLALRVALAHHQAGAPLRAIALDQSVLVEELGEPTLALLEHGDPKRYQELLGILPGVYEALAAEHLANFDLRSAAQAYADELRAKRIPPGQRLTAAAAALHLLVDAGDVTGANEILKVALALPLQPGDREAIEFIVAAASFAALSAFYTKYKHTRQGATLALEAAWRLAEFDRTAGMPTRTARLREVVDAWDYLELQAPGESVRLPYVAWDGAAEYELLAIELEEHGLRTNAARANSTQAEAASLERRADALQRRCGPGRGHGIFLAKLAAAIESRQPTSPSGALDSPFALHLYARAFTDVDLPRSPAIAHGALRILAVKDRLGPSRADLFELSLAGSFAPDAEQTLLRIHSYFGLRSDGREPIAGLPVPVAP